MARVVGLAGSVDTREGYRVHTEAQGYEYVTILRRVDDEDEDRTVAAEERYRVDDSNDREDLEAKATGAVEDALAARGVDVA